MRLGDLLRSRNQEDQRGRGKEEPESGGPGLPSQSDERIVRLPIGAIRVGRWQPRQRVDENEVEELARSIANQGLLAPVVVRPSGDGEYELVAGERRLRACRKLGWTEIPALVRDLDEKEAAEAALVENLQRAQLHFLEEARAYQQLLTEFKMTQEELAERLGKSQPAVANKLRLLRLSPRVQEWISREMISERQARAVLMLESEEEQLEVLREVKERGLSAEETERLVKERREGGGRSTGEGGRPRRERQQRVIHIMKDLRPLRNSVLKLVQSVRKTGLEVDVEEEETGEGYRISILVRLADGKLSKDGSSAGEGTNSGDSQPERRSG
ncbi:MAG: ParB/RepB/Spo0J family partition protein [Limnochordales bacterium]|nr:ParB/RepB/Spo0J family partition protein [Limnochordales bacterium]